MADNNEVVTLNIYNQSPPQLADETSENINQHDQGLNLNIDRQQQNFKYYDNVRAGPNNNFNSAISNNYNKRFQNSLDVSTNNNLGVPYSSPYPPPEVFNYQQTPLQYGNPIVRASVPYNEPNIQPAIIQPMHPINNNTQPRTIINKEKESRKKKSDDDDICKRCCKICTMGPAHCCIALICCEF